jgi:sulfate adenylyltransferase
MGSASDGQSTERVITLDADGLDILEQTLLGARSLRSLEHTLGLERDLPGGITLHDSENTPVARIREGVIAPLRPLPQGVGPQWDPAVRRRTEEIQAGIRAAGSLTVALALRTPPSLAELDKALATVAELRASTLILAALVSRGRVPAGDITTPHVGPNGLVRATQAVAAELSLSQRERHIIPVAIPWPLRHSTVRSELEGEIREILATYGATTVLIGGEQGQLNDTEADQQLPTASRIERERARSAPRHAPATIFFTGLSGSGKSTIARAVAERLFDTSVAEVVLLDGDEMRRRVSQDLGFDRASRNTNVARIAEVAARVVSSGGIAIAAPIAPFSEGRAQARAIASSSGPFLLVHISTPLEVCEARDRKGLYAKARAGEVKDFTGISSPYEIPRDADLVIDASVVPVEHAVDQVLQALKRLTKPQ